MEKVVINCGSGVASVCPLTPEDIAYREFVGAQQRARDQADATKAAERDQALANLRVKAQTDTTVADTLKALGLGAST